MNINLDHCRGVQHCCNRQERRRRMQSCPHDCDVAEIQQVLCLRMMIFRNELRRGIDGGRSSMGMLWWWITKLVGAGDAGSENNATQQKITI